MLGSPYARMCGSSERAKWDLALCSLFQGILCSFSKDSMDFLLSPVEFFWAFSPQ